ncbi:MAG: stage V sporulation protein T [Lachnospiraceae bacterium]
MKATGIVRRIDDLGRVVIPKEIRRTLRIREGDPLEIFTDREGEIILKKYSPIGELGTFARQYAESLSQTMGSIVCVTDRDQIIAAAGNGKKELQDKDISRQLQNSIEQREQIVAGMEEKKYIKIVAEQSEEYPWQVICPILCEGDAIGSVVFLEKETKKKMGDTEQKLALCAAGFLGRQMEQ